MSELKECPFYGSDAEKTYSGNVRCKDANCVLGSLTATVFEWNTRAPSDQWVDVKDALPEGLIEAAENACSEWELTGDHRQDFMVKLRAELDKYRNPTPPKKS